MLLCYTDVEGSDPICPPFGDETGGGGGFDPKTLECMDDCETDYRNCLKRDPKNPAWIGVCLAKRKDCRDGC